VVLKKKIKKVQNSLDNTVEDGCRVMKIVHMVLENKLICESSTEDICLEFKMDMIINGKRSHICNS
jgi:hypothetical protein